LLNKQEDKDFSISEITKLFLDIESTMIEEKQKLVNSKAEEIRENISRRRKQS